MADSKKDATREVQTTLETEPTRDRKIYVPPVDIIENTDAILLIADMPGVDEKNVDITLEKGVLTISGIIEPDERAGYRITYAEYDIGDYQRSFSISDEIDNDKIRATVKDGVLRLTLPKAEPAKPKKIAVTAA